MSANNVGLAAVILAAGKGTRMRSEHPKVAAQLAGRALLNHVIDNVVAAGFRRLVFVVGYRHEEVRALVPELPGVSAEFVMQTEQKGTGHAFLCAEPALADYSGPVLCTAGDMPLLSARSLKSLLELHQARSLAVTVLSARIDPPHGYGRIVRNAAGDAERIVEEKDADEAAKRITEVNTGAYVFNAPAVFGLIKRIGSNNAQNEYYLPDVLSLARAEGQGTDALALENAGEARGVNSPEELAELEALLQAGRA